MGSRRDYTEAFLSTTSAVSPPRPWPSPHMSSWSRFSTWTSCCFYTCRVPIWAFPLWVTKQLHLNTTYTECSYAVLSASLSKWPLSCVHWSPQGSPEKGTPRLSCLIPSHCSWFCDLPLFKRWLTQLHDMWLDSLISVSMDTAGQLWFCSVGWMVWGNEIFFDNAVINNTTTPLTCLYLSISWPHLKMAGSLKRSRSLIRTCQFTRGKTNWIVYDT